MQYADSREVPNYLAATRLDGRGFVVLGAGDGIGRQTCHALAQAGGHVLCVDRDTALAHAVAAEVAGIGVIADVTNRADMVRVFERAADTFGNQFAGIIDIVGISNIGPLLSLDDAGWTQQFDIVLRHAFLAIQLGGAVLARLGGGSMVFVGSIGGMLSVPQQAAYGSAKAALHHLVRCSAHELGPHGVRVNAVAPGFVRSPRLLQRLGDSFWRSAEESNPLGRVAVPADIARAILFLCSGLADYVTGNVLTLDGGVSHVAALPEIRPA